MNPVKKRYPRAKENRLPFSHPVLKANRPKFFKAATLNFVILQLLFFTLFCYLFGSLYQQGPRTHNLNILWVDYDDGIIGDAVRDAYKSLRSPNFPTLIERSVSEYPSESSLYEAVCNTDYWAALYIVSGSSAGLGLAVAGANTTQYNASNALAYIWNEARFPTVVDGSISSNLKLLSDAARAAYVSLNGTAALSTMPPNDKVALSVFTNPWTLTSINIKPTTQGSRAVYNTIVIVLVLIQDFFFLATLNGLYAQFKIYTRAPPSMIILIREIISGTYTMISSMLIAATIWAFRAEWDVSGTQWALTWLTLWLFAHVSFLVLDLFTIWVPPVYVPMCLISWVITNVTSIIIPFALASPFYRWSYALPAHATYEILTDIWSGGCNPHLSYALPVLFVYEIIGTIGTAIGVYRRCHLAVVAEDANTAAMTLRRQASRKLESQQDMRLVREPRDSSRAQSPMNGESTATAVDLGQRVRPVIRGEGELEPEQTRRSEEETDQAERTIQRLETRASRMSNYPAFQLLGSDDS